MELNVLKDFVLLIENHGLALVITGVVLYMVYRYFDLYIKETRETQKKITETLDLIANKIINEYSSEADFILMCRMRARYVITEFKHKMVMYLVNNNIKANINTIKKEIEVYILESNVRSYELLRPKSELKNVELIIKIIGDQLEKSNKEMEMLFDSVVNDCKVDDKKCYDKVNVIRNIETHFKTVETETIKMIEELNF